MDKNLWLPSGTVLQERYQIEHKVGEGGFGITYLAWDLQLSISVAVKEYFPTMIVNRNIMEPTGLAVVVHPEQEELFAEGLLQFEKEMNHLVAFGNQTGTASVRDFFRENNTAYMIMDYVNGITLKEYCTQHGRVELKQVLWIMKSVMDVLCGMHKRGMLHRDVSPDNIIIDKDNRVKLVDFGSTRMMQAKVETEAVVIIKRGFTPIEQYTSHRQQGPWTDVYGVCATMYYMLTGHIPPDVLSRVEEDTIQSLSEWGVENLPKRTEDAIMKGLSVMEKDRYLTVAELMKELYPAKQTC